MAFQLSSEKMSRLCSLRAGVIVGAVAGVVLACGGHVSRGHSLYAEGYYVEAAEVFERSEARLSSWPPRERAAYGLYRGMTLLELGDLQGAARWLAYARWVADENPGALDGGKMQLLAQSQQNLNRQLGRLPQEAPALIATAQPPSPLPETSQGAKNPPEVRKGFAH